MSQAQVVLPGNTNRRERVSMVDLLIKAACFVKKANNVSNIKSSRSKLVRQGGQLY